ncbi:MAG: AAA domain-containing protein, partial [Colwellia sp.]
MQLNEFPYFSHDLINLRSDEDITRLNANQPVKLMEYNGEWLLQQGDERLAVSCTKADRPLFTSLVNRDHTQWMLAQVQKVSLQLQYLTPVEMTRLDIELGIDALVSDDLFTKNEITENNIELACQWMVENFVTDINDSVSNSENAQWLAISRFSNSSFDSSGNGFQLLGKGWRADVAAEHDGRYLIKRITRHSRRDSGFSLLVGSFTFADESTAAALQSATHKATLDASLRDNGSYLELWNLYNDKEWGNALKQAETLKAMRFSHTEVFEDSRVNRWTIWPKSADAYKEFCSRWKSLDIPNNSQVDLSIQAPDWAEELGTEPIPGEQQNNSRGEVRFEEDYVVFTPSSSHWDAVPRFEREGNNDSNGGWLYLSLAGQRTVGKRRLSARQAIDSGKRMPQLKWLLEGVSLSTERRKKVKGLTPYAKKTFKGGEPTDKQILAIEVALNTPDLAIIIGPPGTGKTQVIAALQRRLAEEFEEKNISGQVLVSSFQHDAVDNALDRSQVFNLPATRVGGKKQSAEDEGPFSRWVDKHSTYLKEQVDEQYQNTPMLQQLDEVSLTMTLVRLSQFSAQQYLEQLEILLNQLEGLEQSGMRLSARLLSELEDYIEEQQNLIPKAVSSANNLSILRSVRALRTNELSFSDDGKDRAYDLRRELNRNLHTFSSGSENVLLQAVEVSIPDADLLQKLADLKDQLLDQYLPDYRP